MESQGMEMVSEGWGP